MQSSKVDASCLVTLGTLNFVLDFQQYVSRFAKFIYLLGFPRHVSLDLYMKTRYIVGENPGRELTAKGRFARR